ncbi:Uncharacterized hydrolase YxeP [Raoultella planticola]|uniref:Uncharacterized hydrolase YxeP n=1 Tax=Raoultella planticola TaxID=575 RepID=A0A485B6M0_RAOPL|nr:Uncharacterized hydrolase YxeP [Raoultella planticola]
MEHIFGLHVFPTSPVGTLTLKEGVYVASSDNFDITIRGKGGHGSMPQHCIDPVTIGAEMVGALQQIVARNIDPGTAPVLTIAPSRPVTATTSSLTAPAWPARCVPITSRSAKRCRS